MITARIIGTCKWAEPDDYCFNSVEGNTDFCPRHNRLIRKQEQEEKKALQKRADQIAKQKEKSKQPKKTISKNPKDWSNTFLCSDGTRVNESQVRNKLFKAYKWSSYTEQGICLGCGQQAEGHAHIISKRRCKLKGRTELIWNPENYFEACNKCNMAIENHKGKDWQSLFNIEKCLSFIKQHDPELYAKFEFSATTEPHRI